MVAPDPGKKLVLVLVFLLEKVVSHIFVCFWIGWFEPKVRWIMNGKRRNIGVDSTPSE
jgi:hypothetical protein